ncbi:MAG: hypothetical protein E2O87_00140 [Bacteroidetes bacterium]|nr:MAG: hypothetical protein E2O87_00140 [Bacteroidota bacterium]
MIFRRIEVIDARESRERGNKRYSLAGFFLSLPWCCITPATLSLLGFFGAAGTTRLVFKEALSPLFIVSLLLLGRAHYLIYFKKHGSSLSRVVVWISTIGALALWAFRFRLIAI